MAAPTCCVDWETAECQAVREEKVGSDEREILRSQHHVLGRGGRLGALPVTVEYLISLEKEDVELFPNKEGGWEQNLPPGASKFLRHELDKASKRKLDLAESFRNVRIIQDRNTFINVDADDFGIEPLGKSPTDPQKCQDDSQVLSIDGGLVDKPVDAEYLCGVRLDEVDKLLALTRPESFARWFLLNEIRKASKSRPQFRKKYVDEMSKANTSNDEDLGLSWASVGLDKYYEGFVAEGYSTVTEVLNLKLNDLKGLCQDIDMTDADKEEFLATRNRALQLSIPQEEDTEDKRWHNLVKIFHKKNYSKLIRTGATPPLHPDPKQSAAAELGKRGWEKQLKAFRRSIRNSLSSMGLEAETLEMSADF